MQPFEKACQHAGAWIRDMMTELDTRDEHKAHHALRAGLHALRDRLTVDEAAQLAAQLPMVVRGLFFEGWDPSHKPLKIRHKAEFFALVREKYAPRGDVGPEEIVAALFRVLGRHVTAGEISDVMMTLPGELAETIGGRDDARESTGQR